MISVIYKDLKQSFRDRRAMTLFILFPLVLMWILSTVFAGQFSSKSVDFSGATIIYSSDKEADLYSGFKMFISEIEDMNFTFVRVQNNQTVINQIEDSNYICYLELNEENKTVTMYKNDTNNTVSSFLESLVTTFIQKFNLIYEVKEVNPKALRTISQESSISNVDIVSVDGGAEVRSIDYYGITMLTLIIMYSINTGLNSIIREKDLKTGDRILESPLNKYKLFLGKVIGSFIITILQMLVVIVFSIKVLDVNWGNDIFTILLIIISQILMCVSIGIGIAFLVKKQELGQSLISLGIPFLIFLGGGYYPIDSLGGNVLKTLTKVSPVKWINDSIFNVIHLQDYKYVIPAIGINLVITLLMLFGSSLSFSKREEL